MFARPIIDDGKLTVAFDTGVEQKVSALTFTSERSDRSERLTSF
jgi:hypothetical protein